MANNTTGSLPPNPDVCFADVSFGSSFHRTMYFIGVVLFSSLFGVNTTFFVDCLKLLFTRKAIVDGRRPFSLVIFTLIVWSNTAWATGVAWWVWELVFAQLGAIPAEGAAVAAASSIFNFALADGLMIYRVHVIWRSNSITLLVLLVYLVSIASAIFYFFAIFGWVANTIFANLAWPILAILLNVIFTGLIAGKLIYTKYKNTKLLGEDRSKEHTGVATIILESSALLMVVFTVNAVVQNVWPDAYVLVQLISMQLVPFCTLLVVYRITKRRCDQSPKSLTPYQGKAGPALVFPQIRRDKRSHLSVLHPHASRSDDGMVDIKLDDATSSHSADLKKH